MPDAPMATRAGRTTSPLARDLVAIAIICAAAAIFRATSFIPAVVDTDEGLFMVQGREWLHGGWPLVAAWDMHPVGAPLLFAGAFLLFGVSVEAARLLGMIAVAATGCALYGAARAVGAPRAVGIGAGLLYAAQSVLLSGITTTTELLIAPFVAGGIAIGMRGAARAMAADPVAPGFGAVAAMGLLIGIALLVKQVVVPEGCLAFALLVLPALMRRLLPLGRAVLMALLYAVLCAAPFLAMGLLYWAQGWLAEYVDGSLLAPFRYALERIPGGEAWRRITAAVTLLGFGFAAAAVALGSWRPRDAARPLALLTAFCALWFAVATAAIVGPGFYFAHYFLLWLPPLSLLAAIGCWRLALPLARPGLPRAVFLGLVAVIAANAWLVELHHRFERGPGWPHRDPVREVAAEVRRAAGDSGNAFIANYHPSVYVIAGVGVATRFPFPPHLTGVFEDLSDTNTRAELERVLASRPRVIVVDRGWMHTMRPEAAAMVMAAVARDYELFATVAEQRGPVEIFRARETARPSAPSADTPPAPPIPAAPIPPG
jgi:4-amino-4-deoxy-L-arabinose transferase-like glycosyltransferase